jgi:hypothetical protein
MRRIKIKQVTRGEIAEEEIKDRKIERVVARRANCEDCESCELCIAINLAFKIKNYEWDPSWDD